VNVPPVAGGALLCAADELADTGAELLDAADAGAEVLADGAVELDAVELDALVVFLLDEQAELRIARARLAAAILAHRCFAFISLS
jgi:hypothetical protein